MFINTYVVASDIYKTVKKMYYTERLQWIRDCKNITQKELAGHLGIKQQQYRIRKIRLKSFNFSFSLIYFVFNVYSLNNK